MTNHQDKELSSDLHAVVIAHCEDLERSVPTLQEHSLGPVADEFLKASAELRAALAATPKAPVAQMSGDENFHAWASQNGYPMARDKAGNYLWDSTKAALKIWQAASHPSNAVQDAPSGERISRQQAGALRAKDYPHEYAATVPQVVQAPVKVITLVKADGEYELKQHGYAKYTLTVIAKDGHINKGDLLYTAPQPVAAPIVPSDEQIKAALKALSAREAGFWTRNGLYTHEQLAIAIYEAFTASNAGEAAPAAIEARPWPTRPQQVR